VRLTAVAQLLPPVCVGHEDRRRAAVWTARRVGSVDARVPRVFDERGRGRGRRSSVCGVGAGTAQRRRRRDVSRGTCCRMLRPLLCTCSHAPHTHMHHVPLVSRVPAASLAPPCALSSLLRCSRGRRAAAVAARPRVQGVRTNNKCVLSPTPSLGDVGSAIADMPSSTRPTVHIICVVYVARRWRGDSCAVPRCGVASLLQPAATRLPHVTAAAGVPVSTVRQGGDVFRCLPLLPTLRARWRARGMRRCGVLPDAVCSVTRRCTTP
jgi:hypothetical protein